MVKIDYIINELENDALSFPTSIKPKIIFVGGIPGAGKSLLIDKSKSIYSNDLFYVIDVDSFRKYFSQFNKFEETIQLSNRIEINLLNFLIEKKILF